MIDSLPILTLDIGGTHVVAALVDPQRYELVEGSLFRRPVNCGESAEAILYAWAETARSAMERAPAISAVSLAMPDPFDYERGIALFTGNEKFESLHGMNVRLELAQRLGLGLGSDLPLHFMNDAQCFLQGEICAGAGQLHWDAIGITLGTGLGAAFMRDGKFITAGKGVPPQGRLWDLEFRGSIAESMLSARGLVALYNQLGGNSLSGGGRELARRAAHDPIAQRTFTEFGDALGELLEPWLRDFAPTVLIVGGNIARAWHLFGPALCARVELVRPGLVIEASQLLENAALIGAAAAIK